MQDAKTKSKKQKRKIPADKPLSRSQKKQIAEAVKKAKMQGKIAMSAQQTICYKAMYPDGVCRVTDKFFTKTLQFFDINYQLARNEDKNEIFENYCDFLNYFDHSISVQLSFLNQNVDMEEYQKMIEIPKQEDEFDAIRTEYMQMLKEQIAKGNNGLIKRKFITFGIEADDIKAAKQKLERIEADILGNFKALGVSAKPLSGLERLELLHGSFNEGTNEKFRFNWDLVHKTGLSTKDFIAPTSFDFRDSRTFKGNRDYLFADDIYSNITQSPYNDYEIPGEALSDNTFRTLITEAEKYLGYPYVWGGSSPSTSFDCSGFVCWVFKNSGVYPLSRTTAQGIFNQCTAVRPADAKPGDIIFFTGTYNSGCPVSHVGIYVGNGMMIHCGNPIQYASVNSSYWSSHFYAYGRLN